jgi:hypothetical protein
MTSTGYLASLFMQRRRGMSAKTRVC